MENRTPSALDDFLFDLNGYLILKNAVDSDLLARLNTAFDQFPADLSVGGWYYGAQRRNYTADTGMELHQAVALGGPFAELIDHPSWINYARHAVSLAQMVSVDASIGTELGF